MLIYALAATSLNLILGYGGMVALGHAAFFGAGAYAVGILAMSGVTSALVSWPVAVALAAVLACITGAISLRTRGVYFIMITLAFAQMLFYIFISLRQYGGEDGLNLPGPSTLPGCRWATTCRSTTVLALFTLLSWLFGRLVASRFGTALQGIRENESRMESLGYPVYRIKLAAFTLSGAAAGLAGALLANHNLFISPSLMHWTQSANLLIMVLVGGIGLRHGGVAGAVVMLTLEEVLRLWTEYWHLPLGVLLLGVVFGAPRGWSACWGHGSPAARRRGRARRDRDERRQFRGASPGGARRCAASARWWRPTGIAEPGAGRDPCPDRPQRRRQVHPDPPALGHAGGRRRHAAAGRARRHRHERAPAWPRPVALVPDHQYLQAVLGAGQPVLAVQAHAGSSFRFWRPRAAETALYEQARELARECAIDASLLERPAGTLPHGEQRKVEFALALAARPAVLLLDEPMAGMGPDETLRLTELIEAMRGPAAMLLVEHDMQAVFRRPTAFRCWCTAA